MTLSTFDDFLNLAQSHVFAKTGMFVFFVNTSKGK